MIINLYDHLCVDKEQFYGTRTFIINIKVKNKKIDR